MDDNNVCGIQNTPFWVYPCERSGLSYATNVPTTSAPTTSAPTTAAPNTSIPLTDSTLSSASSTNTIAILVGVLGGGIAIALCLFFYFFYFKGASVAATDSAGLKILVVEASDDVKNNLSSSTSKFSKHRFSDLHSPTNVKKP